MLSSQGRTQLAARTRPPTSTTHMRQTPTGRRRGEWQRAGMAIPSWRAASQIVVPAETVTPWPSIVNRPAADMMLLSRLIDAGDGGGDAAARRERPDDAAAPRPARRHKVVQKPVHHRLVKDAFVAITLQVQLQRLQLDATLAGSVRERDRAEVGLSGFRTEAGELRTDDINGVIATRSGIGEGFQLVAGGCHAVGSSSSGFVSILTARVRSRQSGRKCRTGKSAEPARRETI